MKILCLNCGRSYPDLGMPYSCPVCGGLYDDIELLAFHEPDLQATGIWRHAESIGLEVEPLSLGEGNTPLLPAKILRHEVFFKCEYSNPTGSFKDRGMAVLVAVLKKRLVIEAVEDSSGNAGASFSAYAARAGIKARVFVPAATSGPKLEQIKLYGAEVTMIPGPRSNAAQAVRRAAEGGVVYASHAYSPYVLPGYATGAYEIVEQLGTAPGSIIVPAGQGGLLLGMGRGFQALLHAGKIDKMPMMVGVQASACAPLAAVSAMGILGLNFVTEGETIAEGVRVRTPLRAEAVLKMTRDTGGRIVSINEALILPGRDALAHLGFYVEPTSALVWRALEESLPELRDPIVVILTGAGYKVRI
jgi:threonine synthase